MNVKGVAAAESWPWWNRSVASVKDSVFAKGEGGSKDHDIGVKDTVASGLPSTNPQPKIIVNVG